MDSSQSIKQSFSDDNLKLNVNYVLNIREIFEIASEANRYNDSKTFQKTVMMALASSKMSAEDKQSISSLLHLLSLKSTRTNVSRVK